MDLRQSLRRVAVDLRGLLRRCRRSVDLRLLRELLVCPRVEHALDRGIPDRALQRQDNCRRMRAGADLRRWRAMPAAGGRREHRGERARFCLVFEVGF